jgi:hypothetical protein
VDLYDIVLDGCRAPLTSEQIAGLFHTGRLTRQDRCKSVQNPTWRTVDEVFPLLKYGSSAMSDATPPSSALAPHRNAYVLAAAITVAIVVAVTYVLATATSPALTALFRTNKTTAADHLTNPRTPRNAYLPTTAQPAIAQHPQRGGSGTSALPNRPAASVSTRDVTTQAFERTTRQASFNARVASYNAAMELARRDREAVAAKAAAAERSRMELEKREPEQKRLAGTDFLIRLDKYVQITVGGSAVTVRIHDTGIATFNVWVDGAFRRNVTKEHGLSHTGADETLIYDNGHALLFYVAEISPEQNHCILRVRER